MKPGGGLGSFIPCQSQQRKYLMGLVHAMRSKNGPPPPKSCALGQVQIDLQRLSLRSGLSCCRPVTCYVVSVRRFFYLCAWMDCPKSRPSANLCGIYHILWIYMGTTVSLAYSYGGKKKKKTEVWGFFADARPIFITMGEESLSFSVYLKL